MGLEDGGRLVVEGYTSQRSYLPGEKVWLHVSAKDTYSITIDREPLKPGLASPLWQKDNLDASPRDLEKDSGQGCGWPEASEKGNKIEIIVDDGWPSGFYKITMHSQGSNPGDPGEAFFVVRSKSDSRAKILLVLATNTYNAYNNVGYNVGDNDTTTGNLYNRSSDPPWTVSFHRPLPLGFLSKFINHGIPSNFNTNAGWFNWERPFAFWAETNDYDLDYAVNEDLESHPEILENKKLVLSVGHDEYWSAKMRDSLEEFIKDGGNVAFFSGNTCYWKVDIDYTWSTMTCYKIEKDGLWSSRTVGRPENSLTGVSFCYGVWPANPKPYTIYRPNHWVFKNVWDIKITKDEGYFLGCVGYESDGCDYEYQNGIPVPTHYDETPDNFEILGLAEGCMDCGVAKKHALALGGGKKGKGGTMWFFPAG